MRRGTGRTDGQRDGNTDKQGELRPHATAHQIIDFVRINDSDKRTATTRDERGRSRENKGIRGAGVTGCSYLGTGIKDRQRRSNKETSPH